MGLPARKNTFFGIPKKRFQLVTNSLLCKGSVQLFAQIIWVGHKHAIISSFWYLKDWLQMTVGSILMKCTQTFDISLETNIPAPQM